MAEKETKKKRRRLREIRSRYTDDGKVVHHHTYEKEDGSGEEPERQNVAVSQDADEAGQHVSDQMGMNEPMQQEGAPQEGAGDGAPAGQ